jgi:hypothetical protein
MLPGIITEQFVFLLGSRDFERAQRLMKSTDVDQIIKSVATIIQGLNCTWYALQCIAKYICEMPYF